MIGNKLQIKQIGLLIVFSLFCLTNSVFGQETDSLKTEPEKSIRSAWANKPPSGKAEKTQGGILMALGASGVISGIILLNKKDPCDDISSPNVICTSNIDEIHAQGGVALGIGVGAFIFGIIRYSDGAQKAKAYDEWKKKNNLSFRPELQLVDDRVRLALLIDF